MITVEGVTKTYGKKSNHFLALDNVSFEIPSGSTVAIVGKSGSGKSTLMHIMSGLDHPTTGRVLIDKVQLHSMKPKAMDTFRAKEMSFIFQAFFVEANQTCYQNVMLPLEIAGVPRVKRRALVKKAIESVQLGGKIDNLASSLSGGEKQRLAIARAIVNKPKLIFADEPTGNLDTTTGDLIVKLLFGLNKSLGCSLVIVTHDEDLASLCQIQVRLKDGKVEKIIDSKSRQKK